MKPARISQASSAIYLSWLLLAARIVSGGVVQNFATANASAGAQGAYLGNPEPTIWKRPAILAIGDSITEMGLDPSGGWTARLADAYARKADVINRGFGGYNTITMLLSLPEILDSFSKQRIVLATVWLGANDASRPDRGNAAAYVAVDDFFAKLMEIVQRLKEAGVQNVVLITPPPVNEAASGAVLPGQTAPDRTFKFTSNYAAAVRSAATKLNTPMLDIWKIFTSRQNWQSLLRTDGLHMTLGGQQVVFEELMKLIQAQVPTVRPDALAWHHPTWWFMDYKNATQQWAAEQAAYEAVFGPSSS